jgi:hypothetical protein
LENDSRSFLKNKFFVLQNVITKPASNKGMRTVAIVACAIAAFLPSASGKTPLQIKITHRHLRARQLQIQAVDAAVWQYAAA